MDNMPPAEAAAPQPVSRAGEPPAAGFWIRAGAYMIDGLLVTLVQGLINALLVRAGAPAAAGGVLGSLLGIGYFVWMPVAYQGQTVGKMAAGIGIVRMDGSALTYLRCLGRWAGYLLSGIVLGLGFVMAGFTNQKRALHDYLADTRVVYVEAIGTGRKALIIALGIILPALFFIGLLAAVTLPNLPVRPQ